MPSLSQIYNQGGGATPSVPIGSYVDLPTDTPNLYTVGAQKFLRSGVTALASAYPSVPASLTGPLFNSFTNPKVSVAGLDGVPGNCKISHDGANTMVAFASSNDRGLYYRSTDNGVTWTKLVAPLAIGAVGLTYMNGRFILVYRTGRIYQSTDGLTWTFVTTKNYQGTVARVRFCNGRLFLFPFAGMSHPYNAANAQDSIWWTADGLVWNRINPGSGRWVDIAHNGVNYALIATYQGAGAAVYRCATTGDPTNSWTASTTTWNTSSNSNYGAFCRIVSVGTTFILGMHSATVSSYYYTYAPRSTDNGVTWTDVLVSSSVPGGYAISLHVFGSYVGVSFCNWTGTLYSTFFGSTNSGTSWSGSTPSGPTPNNNPYGAWYDADEIVLVGGKYYSVGYNSIYNSRSSSWVSIEAAFYTTAIFNGTVIIQQWGQLARYSAVLTNDSNRVAIMPGVPTASKGNSVGIAPPVANSLSIELRHATNAYNLSIDGGATWLSKKLPLLASWTGCGRVDSNFYAAPGIVSSSDPTGAAPFKSDFVQTQSVYRSTDLDAWTQVGNLPSDFIAYNFAKCGSRVVALGYNSGYFSSSVSMDNGATWGASVIVDNSVSGFSGSMALSSEPFYEPNIQRLYTPGPYVNGNNKYFHYTEDGALWTRLSCNVFVEAYISQLLVMPTDTIILFSTQSGNVYRSDDEGISWSVTRLDANSSNNTPIKASYDPISGWIFAQGGDAMYISKDGGASFSKQPTTSLPAYQVYAYNKVVKLVQDYYLQMALPGNYVLNYASIPASTGSAKYMRVE